MIFENLLQIGAAFVITNRGNSYYKSGQLILLKIGESLLQIEADLLQIAAGVINRFRAKRRKDHILGHSQ